MYLEQFPAEIIRHIFSYIDVPCAMSQASRIFQNLSGLWYEWEIEKIRKLPHIGGISQTESIVKTYQSALKQLHILANKFYCNYYPPSNLSLVERFSWECQVSRRMFEAINAEHNFHSKKNSRDILVQICMQTQTEITLSFHRNWPLIKQSEIIELVNYLEQTQRFSFCKKLNLLTSGYYFMPEWIAKLKNLEELNFGYNLLFKVIPEIEQLQMLQKINLESNRLESLPVEFGNLTKLEKLYLSDNKFKHIPECIYKLINLKKLSIYRNQIESLSEKIQSLLCLEFLNLNHNFLQKIPDEISLMTKLEILSLRSNQLTTLPASLEQLPELQRLNITNNPISTIPQALKQKPGLMIH